MVVVSIVAPITALATTPDDDVTSAPQLLVTNAPEVEDAAAVNVDGDVREVGATHFKGVSMEAKFPTRGEGEDEEEDGE